MSIIARPSLTVRFDIHYAPAGTPQYKATCERLFSSLLTLKRGTQTPVVRNEDAARKLAR